MSERIVVEATGQARIEGEPDLPGVWALRDQRWSLLDAVAADVARGVEARLIERIRLELMDPRRLVLACASC